MLGTPLIPPPALLPLHLAFIPSSLQLCRQGWHHVHVRSQGGRPSVLDASPPEAGQEPERLEAGAGGVEHPAGVGGRRIWVGMRFYEGSPEARWGGM